MNQNFQQQVLELTRQIPEGKVTTYKQIAMKLNTRAYRAVGTALKRNPDLITTPCHRVINTSGEVGEFVRGKGQKQQLLEQEGIEIKNKKINLKKYLFEF